MLKAAPQEHEPTDVHLPLPFLGTWVFSFLVCVFASASLSFSPRVFPVTVCASLGSLLCVSVGQFSTPTSTVPHVCSSYLPLCSDREKDVREPVSQTRLLLRDFPYVLCCIAYNVQSWSFFLPVCRCFFLRLPSQSRGQVFSG